MNKLKALSVIDGRYAPMTQELAEIFSEYGLIKHRVMVELQWLIFLGQELSLFPLTPAQAETIAAIGRRFDEAAAERIKAIEKTTNHDVKAVEYYIKEELHAAGLDHYKEWTHFACTSEDINNTAYALMLKEGRDQAAGALSALLSKIEDLAQRFKSVPMMSRTHGQPATPTTMGKEMVNFAWRLRETLEKLNAAPIQAKFNGASGNFNAHCLVFPHIDWIRASQTFLADYLQVTPLLFTTQINPYGYIAEMLQVMIRSARITIDFDRDMWGYISWGYFRQKLKEGEVGSSTMPHKVNPIDFENSEGNLGLAIGLMEHLSTKLLVSRFQRDLSDSTALRNLGAVFGYFLIGFKNSLKGAQKIDISQDRVLYDLDNNPELLAEPIQTAMRVYGEENPYETLKALTRGKTVSSRDFNQLIDNLESVPPEVKQRLKALTSRSYTGLAEKLVDRYFDLN